MKKAITAPLLSVLLWVNPTAFAENLARPQGFQMEVLAGDHGLNSVTSKANVIEPVVRIKTASGAPLAGVRVKFELVGKEKRGYFRDEQSIFETETNARGEAMAKGYRPMSTGSFVIRATASRNSEMVSVDIHQRNGKQPYSAYREGLSTKTVLVMVGAGAAGVVTGLVLSSGGSAPSATVSVGSPTVGSPK